jgi:hypothetical protein
MIRYLLGQDFPGMHCGPEPTTDRFMAIVHGEEDSVIEVSVTRSEFVNIQEKC